MSKTKKSPRTKASKWTEAEKAVLDPYKARFREATKEERKDLLEKEILHQFLKLHPNVQGAERQLLKRKVKEWYSNNCRRGLRPSKYALLPPATFTKVLLYEKKDEIEAVARETTDLKPGDPAYMSHYRAARMQVTNELGEDGRREIEQKQVEWNTKGWPPEKQQREAEKHGHQYSKHMDELRYKRLGMRQLTIVWYKNRKGELGVEFIDNNPTIGPKPVLPFEKKFPKEVKDIFGAVWEYAKYILVEEGVEDPGDNTPLHVVGVGRRPLPTCLKSSNGFPILPPVTEEERKLQFRKDLLRSFLTEYYVIVTARPKCAVPWQDIQEDPESWYESKYWPAGVPFRDPSKLKEHEVDTVLTFFRERAVLEANDLFRWKKVANGARGRYTYEAAEYPECITVQTSALRDAGVPEEVETASGAAAPGLVITNHMPAPAAELNPRELASWVPEQEVTQSSVMDASGVEDINDPSLVPADDPQFEHHSPPLLGGDPSFVPQTEESHQTTEATEGTDVPLQGVKEAIGFMTTSNPAIQIPLHGPASGFLPYPAPGTTPGGSNSGFDRMDPILQATAPTSDLDGPHVTIPVSTVTQPPHTSGYNHCPANTAAPTLTNSAGNGIADTQQAAQFLQLLHGSSQPANDTMAAALALFNVLRHSAAPAHYVDPSLLNMIPVSGQQTVIPHPSANSAILGPSNANPTAGVAFANAAESRNIHTSIGPNLMPEGNENNKPSSSNIPSKKRPRGDPLGISESQGTGRGQRNKIPKLNPDYDRGPAAKKGRYKFPAPVVGASSSSTVGGLMDVTLKLPNVGENSLSAPHEK
ncbi:hypothetical protein CVT26_005635 [Gymnopilus dilepis]|uniref:Uncharacterized protein n=1 Tax=Gymnopilus dilepis TaxID=231916 RepID=A0A409XZY1_9AGAR|nr:hypothetical protein CVT26_005635 [Gymnopilus dilepis]